MNMFLDMQLSGILLWAAIGILVVFISLAILVLAFQFLGRLSKKRTLSFKFKTSTKGDTGTMYEDTLTGQQVAAISMALHLILSDEHDEESNIITIKRIERRYSPWSSKIYGLRNFTR